VTVTNSSGNTAHYELLVNGLVSSSLSSTTCTSLANNAHTTWTVTVNNTAGNIAAGTSSFTALAERFTNGTCSNTPSDVQASGTLTITPGSASQVTVTTAPVTGTHTAGRTIGPILVQVQDAFGNPVTVTSATTINLASSSGTGTFATTSGGSSVATVSIAANSSFTTFYYGDTTAGSPILTTSSGSLASWSQQETVT
jgi:hypothetical protein